MFSLRNSLLLISLSAWKLFGVPTLKKKKQTKKPQKTPQKNPTKTQTTLAMKTTACNK